MSLTNFRNSLVQRVLKELWAQWAALGIGSTDSFSPVYVDLEALLIGTWSVGRTSPRLFDEAMSWCVQYGDLVHENRLKKLLKAANDPMLHRVAGAWQDSIEAVGIRWNLQDTTEFDSLETLFLTPNLHPQTTGPTRDEHFEKWGLVRGPFRARFHATAPDFSDYQLMQLHSRKLMGAGCRAEVFGLLLSGLRATTSELAAMTAYSQRLIQDVLGDFKELDIVDWDSGRGRTTSVSLRPEARRHALALASRTEPPLEPFGLMEIRDWPGFYLGTHEIWNALLRIEESQSTGFQTQALLQRSFRTAEKYFSRTTIHPTYTPKLEAGSLEEFLDQTQSYLDSL